MHRFLVSFVPLVYSLLLVKTIMLAKVWLSDTPEIQPEFKL
jgi:hypothetical protein